MLRQFIVETQPPEGGPTKWYVIPGAEYEVMKPLLGNGDGMSVAEIKKEIELSGKRMKNESIYSLLARLMGKNLVRREEVEIKFHGTMMRRLLFKMAVVVVSDREAL